MKQSRGEELYRLFEEARQLPADERADFVARCCGADEALRAEALALLEADAASGEFLAKPALERLAAAIVSDGWSLRCGESIGPYTILQMLGAGGAGEVWRARDERLGRDVAIKVLLPHFASDPERLRQFGDEARTAGALNHSNILTVFDVGEHRGIPYLVSECLDGQSLRQRLDAGPVAVGDAVAIALDIARGLAAAHARSIVHRDLKPENVFLRSDGGVKVLDFGLAKLQSSLEGASAGTHRTITGVIVGTAGYMAPEQVNGGNVDARADLFALGVILYEMLAANHPFRRASTFESLYAVLTVDPTDVSSLNPQVPLALARIVGRLIEKTPGARFQSALDLLWALEQVEIGSPAMPARPEIAPRSMSSSGARSWRWAAGALMSALGLLAAWWVFDPQRADLQADRPVLTRFTWQLPPGMALGSAPVVSPDSAHVAFAAGDGETTRLYVRARGSLESAPIPGSEGAAHPFWSPDGEYLGFFARGRILKVARSRGAPLPLAEALFPLGGAWSRSGTIVFGPDVILAGLRRVPEQTGDPLPATRLEISRGDTSHGWPAFVPDGVHFLYFVRSADDERRGIYLGRIDGQPAENDRPLLRSDSNAIYAPLPGSPDGALLYVVDGRIEARRFDPRTLSVAGDPRTIGGTSAAGATLTSPAMLSASADMLVSAASAIPYGNRLEAVDRSGRRLRFWQEPEAQNWPRLSPDGRYLARQRVDPLRNTPDIWVEDLERGTSVRVTTALAPDIRPVWSPDGRFLAYVSGHVPYRQGTRILSIAAADGTGVVKTFPCPDEYCEPTDWTSRGLLVNVLGRNGSDVWEMRTDGESAGQPLLAGAFGERDGRMSPDGRWLAYVSEEGNRRQVLIQSVTGPPKRVAASGEGGDHPVWRGDGRELFFVDRHGQLQSVAVRLGDGLPSLGRPDPVKVPPIGRGHWGTPYDVSQDGGRIYLLRRNDDPPPTEIQVVMGWRALLD